MKVLLKKEVCGSREQCTRPTRSVLALLKHALKKKQMQDSAFQHYPNTQYMSQIFRNVLVLGEGFFTFQTCELLLNKEGFVSRDCVISLS